MSVAISKDRAVISRAQPPEVALIGALSSEAVKAVGSPLLRGIVGRKSDAGATSRPAAWPSLAPSAASDRDATSPPAPSASAPRTYRRSVSRITLPPVMQVFEYMEWREGIGSVDRL